MFLRPVLATTLTAVAVLCRPAVTSAQEPTAEDVLLKAGEYLDQFRRDVAGVVLEEDYMQEARARVPTARRLRSDLAVILNDTHGWVEFRDVFEVDGKPVRDRQDRIVALFAQPTANAFEQARRVVAESSRFNLVPVGLRFERSINLPMAALLYLTAGNQARSTFRSAGTDKVGGRRTVVLRFTETAQPRMIGTADDAAARGTFWVDPETGIVLKSEFMLRSRGGASDVTATIRVEYAEDRRLQLWLPHLMEEEYVIGGTGPAATLTGRAVYSNARKFEVVTDEAVTE
jgi:hypothetical protein